MIALGMLIVSLKSYVKRKNQKLLILSLMFIVFLVKGILLSLALLIPTWTILEFILSNLSTGWLDLVILLLLFLATVKR
jgi:hypothetical protein